MKTLTNDILRKFAPIATILLVGLLCGSAALAGTVDACAVLGGGALAPLIATDFAGFTTDVSFRTNGGSLTDSMCSLPSNQCFFDGTIAPQMSDSNTGGSVIGFGFNTPLIGGEIFPGDASNVLMISTNATMWTAGSASVIDGGSSGTLGAFQPTNVPEPASLGLLERT